MARAALLRSLSIHPPSLSLPLAKTPMTPLKPTLALYHPHFLGGGAEAVCLWMIEALQSQYDLTLFTLTTVDWAHLNAMYGTHIRSENVRMEITVPLILGKPSLGRLCRFLVANLGEVRQIFMHLTLRRLKRAAQRFDGVISSYNAADLGRPGLQYIHWVKVLEDKKGRYCWISEFSREQLRRNQSLVNSERVAEAVAKTYQVPTQVVYPPVVMPVVAVPWTEKATAFICSGRLVAAKSPHRAIELLQEVRQQGESVHLHLTGGGGGTYARKYHTFLRRLIAENRDWVTLHENLSYEAYIELLSRCRYGIHLKPEPFGIVVAEMVKAGVIPFVRRKGGQVEIVGDQPELLYDTAEEAVTQILAVLRHPDLQHSLGQRLQMRRDLFSVERFCREIQGSVELYLQNIGSKIYSDPK